MKHTGISSWCPVTPWCRTTLLETVAKGTDDDDIESENRCSPWGWDVTGSVWGFWEAFLEEATSELRLTVPWS